MLYCCSVSCVLCCESAVYPEFCDDVLQQNKTVRQVKDSLKEYKARADESDVRMLYHSSELVSTYSVLFNMLIVVCDGTELSA